VLVNVYCCLAEELHNKHCLVGFCGLEMTVQYFYGGYRVDLLCNASRMVLAVRQQVIVKLR